MESGPSCAACGRGGGERGRHCPFPELSLTGYSVRDLNAELAIGVNDKLLDPVKSLSRKISIGLGTMIRDETGAIRNALVYFEDGAVKHTHFKVYLPTYGIFEEQRLFSSREIGESVRQQVRPDRAFSM